MWNWLRKLIFLTLSAETAHHAVLTLLAIFGRIPGFKPLLRRALGTELAPNPVGLGAGLDKNAQIVGLLPHFGFGFAEVGTVTPEPQPGNEKRDYFEGWKTPLFLTEWASTMTEQR